MIDSSVPGRAFSMGLMATRQILPGEELGVSYIPEIHIPKAQRLEVPIRPPAQPPTLHPAPYTLHPTPYTLHPTPYALRPTPYTLHPTPYTLHPTPCTPHPSPSPAPPSLLRL